MDAANDTHLAQRDDEHSHHHARYHAMHCFDYLRQGIQCSADDALEEGIPELGGVSGWGTIHRCRDFDALKRNLQSN